MEMKAGEAVDYAKPGYNAEQMREMRMKIHGDEAMKKGMYV
jgi:hypothetical protein